MLCYPECFVISFDDDVFVMVMVYSFRISRYKLFPHMYVLKKNGEALQLWYQLCCMSLSVTGSGIRARVLQLVASGLGCYICGIRAGIGSLRAYRKHIV